MFSPFPSYGATSDKIAAPIETDAQNVNGIYQENLDNALAIINLVVIPIVRTNIKNITTPQEA